MLRDRYKSVCTVLRRRQAVALEMIARIRLYPRRSLVTIGKGLFAVGLLMMVVLATFLIKERIQTVSVAGHHLFAVTSPSMKPSIPTGGLVLVRNTAPEGLKTGDVITFREGREIVIHRIQSMSRVNDGLVFITQGDASSVVDPARVPADGVVGQVTLVLPLLGYFILFSQSPWVFLLLVVVPGAVLLVNELKVLLEQAQKQEKVKSADVSK